MKHELPGKITRRVAGFKKLTEQIARDWRRRRK